MGYTWSRLSASWGMLFALYLLWVTVAELLTAAVNVQAGLVCHAALLLALLLHGAVGRTVGERHLALALTLAPLIRLLSTAIPLFKFPQPAWYPLVTAPLLLATWLAVRQFGISRPRLNLRLGNWRLQLMLGGMGLGLGFLEHAILHPVVAVASFSWVDVVLFALSLAIFTGFSEELIFRSVLQAVALPVMGRGALLYVAVLFGVLHIGYLSVLDVVFVTAVGLLFAYLVRWGGSILGVTLAHALTNISLFLVMPGLDVASPALATQAAGVIVGSSLVGLLGILLVWRARRAETPLPLALMPPADPSAGRAAPALVARPPARASAPDRGMPGYAGTAGLADPRAAWEAWRTATLAALMAEHAARAGGPLVPEPLGLDGSRP